jgi:hypothetical protein
MIMLPPLALRCDPARLSERLARKSFAGRKPAFHHAWMVCFGAAWLLGPSVAHAQVPNLGTAADFAVLAGSAVTNTGPSVLTGNLGVR